MIQAGLIILAIALLIAIVWALHRNQQQHNEESVDRNAPLPPLELRDNEQVSAEDILGIETGAPVPARQANPVPAAAAAQPGALTENWLETSRSLLQDEAFEAAIAACEPALPPMGAFRQICQILRARMRAQRKAGKAFEETLATLYHYAALADFFHARGSAGKPLSSAALKHINFAQWKDLDAPYPDLGYENLALLSKTDIKALQELWGEPQGHAHLRELHMARWQSLQASQTPGSTHSGS